MIQNTGTFACHGRRQNYCDFVYVRQALVVIFAPILLQGFQRVPDKLWTGAGDGAGVVSGTDTGAVVTTAGARMSVLADVQSKRRV